MDATSVAIDLAKEIFEVALANRAGQLFGRLPQHGHIGSRRIDSFKRGCDRILASSRSRPTHNTVLPAAAGVKRELA